MILAMFDIDGTLTHPIEEEPELFMESLRLATGSRELTMDWSKPPVHFTDRGLAEEIVRQSLDRELTSDELDRMRAAYQDSMWPVIESRCRALPGALDLLVDLSAADGIAVAIATGNWRPVAIKKLDAAQIDAEGMPIGTSSESIARTGIMQHTHDAALLATDVDAFDHIVYFGDGIWDAHATLEMGWRFMGISTHMEESEMRELGADEVFGDYLDRDAVKEAIRG